MDSTTQRMSLISIGFKALILCFAITTFSCSTAKQSQNLPTVAMLPSATQSQVPIITPTSLSPSFTLVPTISAINIELTHAFRDPKIREAAMSNLAPIGFPARTPNPTEVYESITSRAYSNLFFKIINQQMPMIGAEGRFLGGTANSKELWFKYEYISTKIISDLTQSVPNLLCNFQAAGLTDQKIKFTIEQNFSDKSQQGYLFCILPDDIKALNCSAPKQMNIGAIQTSPGCLQQ